MTTVNIDGTEYDTDSFSEEARAQYNSIRFIDSEIVRLEALLVTLRTAKVTYGKALKSELESNDNGEPSADVSFLGETISFD